MENVQLQHYYNVKGLAFFISLLQVAIFLALAINEQEPTFGLVAVPFAICAMFCAKRQ